MLFCFNNEIGAFNFTGLDIESETVLAQMYLYDGTETLLQTIPLAFPGGETGGGEAHSVGFTRATNDVKYVMVVVGATAAMPTQNNNRLAIGDIRYVEYSSNEYTVIQSL